MGYMVCTNFVKCWAHLTTVNVPLLHVVKIIDLPSFTVFHGKDTAAGQIPINNRSLSKINFIHPEGACICELHTLIKEKFANSLEKFSMLCASWTKSNSFGKLCFMSLTNQSNWKLGNNHEVQ